MATAGYPASSLALEEQYDALEAAVEGNDGESSPVVGTPLVSTSTSGQASTDAPETLDDAASRDYESPTATEVTICNPNRPVDSPTTTTESSSYAFQGEDLAPANLVQHDHETEHDNQRFFSYRKILLCVCVAITVIAAIVAAVIVFSTKDDKTNHSSGPGASSLGGAGLDPNEVYSKLQSQLVQFSEPTLFVDPTSPQSRAFDWMVSQDEIEGILSAPTLLQQRYALVVLFMACGGSQWEKASGWATQVHECEWQGVVCSHEGSGDDGQTTKTVIELDLARAGLTGKLPEEIGLLSGLTSFDASDNRLEGILPDSLFQLANLASFNVEWNELSFRFDETPFWQLPKLSSLILSNNRDIGGDLPSSMKQMSLLKDLDLSSTKVAGRVFDFVEDWSRLEALTLSFASFISGTIPSNISLLSNLHTLRLHGTAVTGSIPSELGMVTSLVYIYLGNVARDSLTGTLPTEVANCINLEFLQIEHSQINGSIPSQFGDLTNLELLWLTGSDISGTIPVELQKLTALSQLILDHNQLRGPIPESLGELSSLVKLSVLGIVDKQTIPNSFCRVDLQFHRYCNLKCDCCGPACYGLLSD